MVTSFRPRSCEIRDDTVLTTVRPVSDLSELYHQFGVYRLEVLIERAQNQLNSLRADRHSARKTDVRKLKSFLQRQIEFLEHTDEEIVEDHYVTRGEIDDGEFHVPSPTRRVTKKRKQSPTTFREELDVEVRRDKKQKQS